MGSLGGDDPLKGDEVGRHEDVRDQVQVEERSPEGHRGQQGQERGCARGRSGRPGAACAPRRELSRASAGAHGRRACRGTASGLPGTDVRRGTASGAASTVLREARLIADFLARRSITLSSGATGADRPSDDSWVLNDRMVSLRRPREIRRQEVRQEHDCPDEYQTDYYER